MTKKTTEATESMTAAANDAFKKSQDMLSDGIGNSEKAVESMIEFSASAFKGAETVSKKMYENYVSNVGAMFDGMKALNKTTEITEFYKVAASNMSAASERMSEQSKSLMELSSKVAKDTGEAARTAYSKGFAVAY